MKTRVLRLLTMVLALVSFTLSAPLAHANAADQRIGLVAQPNILPGKASAKYRDRRGEQELQVELETARRLAGATFLVAVGEKIVGQMTINAFGKGRLSLNSRRGEAVPEIEPGTVVSVVAVGGVVVFAGSF